MRDCTYFEDLLSARLDGELTEAESQELDAHLETCPACRAYAEDLLSLNKDFQSLLAPPPAGLADRILADLSPSHPQQPKENIPMSKPNKKRPWFALAAAAVLVIALVVAVPTFTDMFGGSQETATADTAAPGGFGSDPAEPSEGTASGEEGVVQDSESESTEEDAPAQEPGKAVPEDVDPLYLLSEAEALLALEEELALYGKTYELEGKGLSDDGSQWLFFAKAPAQKVTALYAVDRHTGAAREEFVAIERPAD